MSDLERRIAQLSPQQRAALEQRLASKTTAAPGIPIRSDDDGHPLSFAEHRLWLVDRIEPDHPFYNMPLAANLSGPLSLETLQKALTEVARRHESLRTTYHWEDDEPVRRVAEDPEAWPMEIVAAESFDDSELQRRLRLDARRPFDIQSGPLMRCHVYRQSEHEHVVLLVMHHIISDGWSTAVLLREWSACYDAILASRPLALPPLPISYGDFAVWQRKLFAGERMQRELAYWEQQLQGLPAVMELPLDHPRPSIQDFDGGRCEVVIPSDLGRRIQTIARAAKTTSFAVLLAGYAALLRHFTTQDDLAIGAVVANRREPSLESLIGFFVNTLVIRCQPQATKTFAELVNDVASTFSAALSHQDLPFERLVESLAPGRDRSHSPLFQTALVLQEMPLAGQNVGELCVEPIDLDHGTAKHDLTILLFPDGEGFRGHVEFRRRLFETSSIERLTRGWLTLLQAACESPSTKVAELPFHHADDDAMLRRWSQGLSPADRRGDDAQAATLHDEVDQRGANDDVAVIGGDVELTFEQLRQRTVAFAQRLCQRGVAPGDRVLVALPRSVELVVRCSACGEPALSTCPWIPRCPVSAGSGWRTTASHD